MAAPESTDLATVRAENERLRAENERLRTENQRLSAENERHQRLLHQVMAARDRDRREAAQRLHDYPLHALSGALLELEEAAKKRRGVGRAKEILEAAISRLREEVVALHPVTLERRGLAEALSAVARIAEPRGGFRCTLAVDESAACEHASLFFECGRQLLNNAAQHSGARNVRVILERKGDEAVLEVADDGLGIDPERARRALDQGHVGLATASQRLEVVGGRLEVTGEPGEGSTIRAWVPVGG